MVAAAVTLYSALSKKTNYLETQGMTFSMAIKA
jgi:hypothetical protein